ncbi:MAG: hypothetical protein KAY37_08460, partial [Phycisphaerae bacterium]|nr:hypothetical protein [Phycisphaerae bacterium]
MHVVCKWIGNSQAVAAKHYLQVTDEHFERAAKAPEAVQNPVQHSAARCRTASRDESVEPAKSRTCGSLRDNAARCDNRADGGMGDTGLEPVTS